MSMMIFSVAQTAHYYEVYKSVYGENRNFIVKCRRICRKEMSGVTDGKQIKRVIAEYLMARNSKE